MQSFVTRVNIYGMRVLPSTRNIEIVYIYIYIYICLINIFY